MHQYGVRKRSECRRLNKILKRKRERRDNGKKRTENDESNEKERKIEKQKDRDSYDLHWFEWDFITLKSYL